MVTSAFTLTYKSIKEMKNEIREQSGLFNTLFKSRSAGFLHPASWISPLSSEWKMVNASKDIVPGTVVHFSPSIGAVAAATQEQTDLVRAVVAFTPEDLEDFEDVPEG